MAPPLPDASQPSKTAHSGGATSPHPRPPPPPAPEAGAQRRADLTGPDLPAQQQAKMHQPLLRRGELLLLLGLGQPQREVDVVQPAPSPGVSQAREFRLATGAPPRPVGRWSGYDCPASG